MRRYLPELHHRHALRLQGKEYAPFGVYYVTICTHNRLALFGTAHPGVVRLSVYGSIVAEEWLRTETLRSEVVLDAYVVMPHHIHGIIVLTYGGIVATRDPDAAAGDGITMWDPDAPAAGDTTTRDPDAPAAGDMTTRNPDAPAARPYAVGLRFGPQQSGTLPAIIGQFKAAVTKRINYLRGTPGTPVWQSRYYDRIVRSDDELNRIRRYIRDNPRRHP